MTWTFAPGDFDGCRRYWLAGLCPCCGSATDGDEDAEAVAEGVVFCGRCIRNRHHCDPPEFLPAMLTALLPPPSLATLAG